MWKAMLKPKQTAAAVIKDPKANMSPLLKCCFPEAKMRHRSISAVTKAVDPTK